MKRIASTWIIAALVAAAPAAGDELLVDGIAAQVGSEIVLASEVMEMVGPVEAKMRQAGAPQSEIAKIRADGLERLIEQILIAQFVADSELYASDDEIDQTISAIARQNDLTVDQIKDSLSAHGMTYAEYRDQIKRDLERRKVVQTVVGARVRVEENEVEALYAERYAEQPKEGVEFHMRQLLVTYGKEVGRSRETACGQAREAREKIEAGEPFQKQAELLSAVAPRRGGDIGWLHEDTLASWMAEIARSLEPGEVSEVVELPAGCTVLQLVERREYTPVTFEMAKQKLETELFDSHLNDEYIAWLEKLRERTYIERKGHFAEAARFGESPFAVRPQPEDTSTP